MNCLNNLLVEARAETGVAGAKVSKDLTSLSTGVFLGLVSCFDLLELIVLRKTFF